MLNSNFWWMSQVMVDADARECRSCRKNGTPYMEKAPVPYPPVLHSLASASTITWLIHQKFQLQTVDDVYKPVPIDNQKPV